MDPNSQVEWVIKNLDPIKHRCLGMVNGNHNDRTRRACGIDPDMWIAKQLGVNFYGFSGYIVLGVMKCFYKIYMHHNRGGGAKVGSKVAATDKIWSITPTADAIFTAHTHITARVSHSSYDLNMLPTNPPKFEQICHIYIGGSALEWDESYAEQIGLSPAVMEQTMVTFNGVNTNDHPRKYKKQTYHVIAP